MKKAILILVVLAAIAALAISEIYNISNSAGDSRNCNAALDGNGNMHVVWQDNSDGKYAIYYKKISSNGNMGNAIKISNSSGSAINPAIAIDGSIAYIVWQDNRSGQWNIYYREMTINGIFLTNETLLCQNESIEPTIAARNGKIFIAWAEKDGNDYHIHYTMMTAPPNTPPAASFTFYPKMAGIGDEIHFNSTSYDSDGIIINYTWQFGDGSIAYGKNVSHSYSENGTYVINLTITDDGGATSKANGSISIGKMIFVSSNYNSTTPGFGKYHFKSIQDAIDNASANATIKIFPGLYKENIVIDKSLKLIDDPVGYTNAVIDANGGIGIKIMASNVFVKNITIFNGSMGILATNDTTMLKNITVTNCHIFNLTECGIKFDGVNESIINSDNISNSAYGIYLNNSCKNMIEYNAVNNEAKHAIFSKSSSNNFFAYNILYSNNWSGIFCQDNSNNITITGNTIYESQNFSGIGCNGIENITIYNNSIYASRFGITLHRVTDSCIGINKINDSLYYGIRLWYVENSSIYSNHIYDNGEAGIDLMQCSNNSIFNNSLLYNGRGIYLEQSTHSSINGNTILNNTNEGIRFDYSSNNSIADDTISYNRDGTVFYSTSCNNAISNCILRNNQHHAFYSDENSRNNIAINMTIASYPTKISFFYGNGIALKGVDESMPNDGLLSINKFVNISNITTSSWINITFYYDDENAANVNESTLALYEWNGSEWNKIESNLDIENNTINANISSFSIYGIFGELNYPYELHAGWNLITVPINATWHAWDLANYINKEANASICTTIVMLQHGSHIAWVSAISDFNNFTIKPGMGYWIYVKENATITWTGELAIVDIKLHAGYSLIGWSSLTKGNASVALHRVKNASIVITWNESMNEYETYIKTKWGYHGDNFELPMGRGFYVYCSDADKWHGG